VRSTAAGEELAMADVESGSGGGDRVAEVERLLEQLDGLRDPAAQAFATATVQAVVELYGDGLARLVDCVEPAVLRRMASEDPLVGHLLLVHDLHPVSVEERVRDALISVRPYLASHGGDVTLVAVVDGVAMVRLSGSCDGCAASASTMTLAVEQAVLDEVPDVERVEAEGVAEAAPAGAGLLQIETIPGGLGGAGGLPMAGQPTAPPGTWTQAGALPQLNSGGTLVKRVGGEELLFLRIDGTSYAYRPRCPACDGSLEGAALDGAELACPGCGNRFDARRAGRCLDRPRLQLDPVPLLVDDAGLVRVAVGSQEEAA